MYKRFFGLKKNPFNVNPDPAYLYLTSQMRQSLDELTYGIENRKGLMLLTGEAGTGKTTLINHLLLWLGHRHARTAFIFNSHLDSSQLFDFILADFDIPSTPGARSNPLLAFNEWLLARYRAHDLVVLIVDEAQGLPVHVLEEIRLLLNMETPNEKLLQIVLAGQPELETKLKRPDLRQLHQRIALRCKTEPLTLQETANYITDRLHTAGSNSDSVFMPEAIEAIYSYSRGIPRVINLLCENALINAYVDHLRPIPPVLIDEAARELQFDEFKPVAPRLQTINKSTSVTDLHSILAKIRADADAADEWPGPNKVSPYLVNTKAFSDETEMFVLDHDSGYRRRPLKLPNVSGLASSSRAGTQLNGVPAHDFAKPFPVTLSQRFNLRATAESALEAIRAWKLHSKMKRLTSRIRTSTKAAQVLVSEAFGPEVKTRGAATWKTASTCMESLKGWGGRNFNDDTYEKSFVASACLSTFLYFVARRMNPVQGWQHPGQMIIGFAGLLLCVLSVGLGVTILVQARQKLLKDWPEMSTNVIRWLRAPIYPMQMRAFGSIAHKIQTQRRA